MHVAFLATYGLWSPHIETELEIAERHLLEGDTITWVICDGALEACDSNPGHDQVECLQCRFKVQNGIKALSGRVKKLKLSTLLSAADHELLSALPDQFTNFDELKAVTHENLDAGWGALSSAIWIHKDVAVDLNNGEASRFLRAAIGAYLATRRLLDQGSVDRIYAFNGRMAPFRGVLRAAQRCGVPCHVHERGRDIQHYATFENCMPHEIEQNVERVHRAWSESDLTVAERRRIGMQWFEGRTQGQMGAWISYVEGQQSEELPADWDPARRNIVFYTSTEYEFASIGKDWKSPIFGGPTEAAIEIAKELSGDDRLDFTIRIHPNPDSATSSSVKALLEIDLPGVRVIPPGSPVSTYALMRAADIVVAAGSTAGIEATYWGRPSVQAGRGLFSGLDAVYEPVTREALFDLLANEALEPIDPDPAIRYAYYQATVGIPFRFFEPDGLFAGTFKGKRLRPSKLQRKLLRFLRRRAPKA